MDPRNYRDHIIMVADENNIYIIRYKMSAGDEVCGTYTALIS